MTKTELIQKYHGDTAAVDEIIKKKESDAVLKKTCCRPHPEPGLKDNPAYRQYLSWDEEYETEQEDQILTKLCSFMSNDEHAAKDNNDGKDAKKVRRTRRSARSETRLQTVPVRVRALPLQRTPVLRARERRKARRAGRSKRAQGARSRRKRRARKRPRK